MFENLGQQRSEVRVRVNLMERAVVLPETMAWMPTRAAGIERVPLDRFGENARATSIVRFAPNSAFPRHTHVGGEEMFVLGGLFVDEHGRYPAGTYLRNPIGSQHAPSAGPEGATLFVKLHQSSPDDPRRIVLGTATELWLPGVVAGLTVLPLYEWKTELSALVRWAPNTRFTRHAHGGGEEILVLEGVLHDDQGTYPRGTWIRNPHLFAHAPFTEGEGATILVKTGHLPRMG
jgi:anti-sigma factor ChrR (cupin superfamily)